VDTKDVHKSAYSHSFGLEKGLLFNVLNADDFPICGGNDHPRSRRVIAVRISEKITDF
jgi:hypothetical protein